MSYLYEVEEDHSIDGLVNWVQQHQFSIALNSERLSFLLAIAVISREKLDEELSEGELHDAFKLVSEQFKDTGESSAFRANNAINEMVSQRIFSRFTSEGSDGQAIYRLSPLAVGICDYYLRHRAFSKLKLSIQLSLVTEELNKAQQNGQNASTPKQWRNTVYATLKYSVSELFDQIDLNQRVMDEQQTEVKSKIAELLNVDWREAISECERLLSETSENLYELQSTLHAAGDELQTSLLTLQEMVWNDEELEYIASLLFSLQMKLDRIVSWGQQAIDLWIGYDRHIHKYIRTVIDMDKNRAFSQRLRESIQNFESHGWQLVIADADRLFDMRDESLVLKDAEVTGYIPQELEYEEISTVNDELYQRVAQHLKQHREQQRSIDLGSVLSEYLTQYPHAKHFDIARMVIDQAVRLGVAESDFSALQPEWKVINTQGAKVQANVINKF